MRLKDEEIFLYRNKLYNSFLSIQYKPKNIIVYLDVVFPIVFSYEKNDKIYLAYVVTCDEFENELNIISTQIPDYSILELFAESKLSLFEIFDKEFDEKCLFFGTKKGKVFNGQMTLADKCNQIPTLEEFHEDDYIVEDLLPEDDFYVTRHTVNKLNLNEIRDYIKIVKARKEKNIETTTTLFKWETFEKRRIPDKRGNNNKMLTEIIEFHEEYFYKYPEEGTIGKIRKMFNKYLTNDKPSEKEVLVWKV
ncbi:hypothetical protein [Paenibacillus sp. JJ-223]|uniref:hypothetical protein n=1 Tax=Paenibacillus sp. JJ-223 TaxID=2905647 RepID=UPI001F1C6AB6|nr:hypothetical protein [Paenibacillus sp. JJ-223]CAH1220540.1 hypothetical protein PAECIP111890_05076 [Paenibacillus sp. JJ-223]